MNYRVFTNLNGETALVHSVFRECGKYVRLFLHLFRRYGNTEGSTWNIIKIVNMLIIFRLGRTIFSIKVDKTAKNSILKLTREKTA